MPRHRRQIDEVILVGGMTRMPKVSGTVKQISAARAAQGAMP